MKNEPRWQRVARILTLTAFGRLALLVITGAVIGAVLRYVNVLPNYQDLPYSFAIIGVFLWLFVEWIGGGMPWRKDLDRMPFFRAVGRMLVAILVVWGLPFLVVGVVVSLVSIRHEIGLAVLDASSWVWRTVATISRLEWIVIVAGWLIWRELVLLRKLVTTFVATLASGGDEN